MEWDERTPSLWDWDNALLCDAGDYKSPRDGDSRWAAGTSTSSSTSSSPRVPGLVPSSVLEFEDVYQNASALIFQDAENLSPATVTEGTTSPPIGLKLGKRTYFEDATPEDQTSFAVALPKKPRECDQSLQQQVYCQVEGCDVELSAAKEYYRKHRVCEDHTKCPQVIVAGQERRFCQQCSRFHALLEFDQKKRSCRKRLSDHNARRRKPQPDVISFCSSIFSLSTYDDEDDHTHQISFQRHKSAHIGPMSPGAKSSAWGFLYDSKLPQTRSCPLVKNAGHEVGQLPFKVGTAGVLNLISSAVSSASSLGRYVDLPGDLSLSSSNPRPSSDTGEILTSPLAPLRCHQHNNNSILRALEELPALLPKQWIITVDCLPENCNALLSDAEL